MILKYDVIVIGGGHAGCEAACASANMGAKTCLVTMDMNKIAQMSCNPAIGGIAKGQIVREIDALGGQMGLVTDATAIQFRMLNVGKGPAMWSPRAQCDRGKFIWQWRKHIDETENLEVWQDQADELITEPIEGASDGNQVRAIGVRTIWGAELYAKCVVITAGTFLNGLMHIGRKMVAGGRIAEPAVPHFTESITRHGVTSARMKTGTPVRIDKRSIHFDEMEVQPGETRPYQFSYLNKGGALKQLPCWTVNTNAEVHEILKSGLEDSPLYNGQIQSIGPRYCPSIETKLVTFPDRDKHPLFLEPEGEDTNEMYLNGFSSSLPMDVQIEALKKMPAFRDIKVYRPGYAIEYDFFDPTQLNHSLESKIISNLFMAGQVNGTTGYEDAESESQYSPFVLHRDEAYIGVLIDDLVTKGVDEPYRMFTSRAEYRILLRQDDADARLTEKAYDLNSALEALGTTPLQFGCKLIDLVNRPQLNLSNLSELIPQLKEVLNRPINRKEEIAEAAEIRMKYKGYIEREKIVAEKMHRLENIKIRGHFNYEELKGLSTECRQKLMKIQPETLAQASRIPGVSPSDINVLLVLMGR